MQSPKELGIEAFDTWRGVQVTALEKILNSSARTIILQGPTGSGKSGICAGLQKLLNTRVLYTCRTHQLQDQFLSSFPYAVAMKGRLNYPTLLYQNRFPKVSADLCMRPRLPHCLLCCNGQDQGERCTASLECPYLVQKRKALAADLAVLNIALFLNEANYAGGFSNWPWLHFDEADELDSELMHHVEFSVSEQRIKELKLPPPDKKTVAESWIEWASKVARPRVLEAYEQIKPSRNVEAIKEAKELERFIRRLDFFLEEVTKTKWVFIDEGPRYAFRPVFVNRYADFNLWRHSERHLCLSATIISPSQFCRDLGLKEEETQFIDLSSTFPKERRRIYYAPAADVTHKTKSIAYPKLVEAIDSLLNKNSGVKVLIHTVSYELATFIMKNSAYSKRMRTYTERTERGVALEDFKRSPEPLVLVASSFQRGVDLPGSLCRAIIVAKVPYPDLSDKQIAARVYSAKDGEAWYAVQTVRDLVQATGRGMRYAEDWCISYILDEQFSKLYRKWRYLFPSWWREALVGIK